MRRFPWSLLVLGAMAAALLTIADVPAGAQQKDGKDKKDFKTVPAGKMEAAKDADIVTVDFVELHGKFYPSSKGKDAPVVMMLHALADGENSSNKEWVNMAKKLQEKGYAVLTFDFRGYGESTTVKPGMPNKNPMLSVRGFWDEPTNASMVKGLLANKPRPTEIKSKDFAPGYVTCLANDIAAAKNYLDEKNDNGECNSGNIVILASKDAATLASLWLNSEWQRYKFLPPGPGMPQAYIDRQNPEGAAVTAGIFLSATPHFGKTKNAYNLPAMLEIPAKIYKMPIMFMYGDGDEAGKKVALSCEKVIRGTNSKEYPFTAAVKVKDAEAATGKELLLDAYDASKQILEFLEGALNKKNVPKMRVNTNDMSVWFWTDRSGRTQQVFARQKGMPLPAFNTYAGFLIAK